MIPYFEQPTLHLGPLTIHAFGVLVAMAVWVGHRVYQRRVRATGLDPVLGDRLLTFMLVGGFIGAHLVDRLVYFPRVTMADPLSILKIWEGLSSFGGFLGAVVGAWVFMRKVPFGSVSWAYLDAVAYAFPFGWIFGRLGCFVAFDHPGLETTFFLAERYYDGKIRHNLGLDEAIYTVFISAMFYVLARKKRYPGYFLGLLPLIYAPFRFLADFLRTRDVRYGGLTPGQWGTMALVVLGVGIMTSGRRRARTDAVLDVP